MLLSSSLSFLVLFQTLSGGVSATHGHVPARSDPGSEVPAQTIEQAREVLDQNMADYTRARFKDVRAVMVDAKEDGTGAPVKAIVFCGQVNGPNRVGGMSGWTHFRLRPDTHPTFAFQTSPGFNPRLHPDCEPGAYPAVSDEDFSAALTYSVSISSL